MKLSILIPVYNEEETISQVLTELAHVKLSWQKEIIIIDDGSTDGTANKIKEALHHLGGSRPKPRTESARLPGGDRYGLPRGVESQKRFSMDLKIITHKKNLGKGAAIRSGIAKATGDYILIQDADLEYKPKEIPKLLSALKRKQGKIAVYGSRFMDGTAVIPLLYRLGNYFLTWMTNVLFRTHLTDMETGYKLLPGIFLKNNTPVSNHFDMEPEITAKLIISDIPIVEVPISYSGRSRISGKKLTVKDAVGAIRTLFSYRISSA